MIFIFFFLVGLRRREKETGLVLYFFLQRFGSFFLFMRLFFLWDKIVFGFLLLKLGVFPFFYWIVVLRVKVRLFVNLFVLSVQKISVFWLMWLRVEIRVILVLLVVYFGLFFVVVILLRVRDLWLILVYSSVANTGIIILRVVGSYYISVVILYLRVIFCIIRVVKWMGVGEEIVFIVLFFLVVPPFFSFLYEIMVGFETR